jgi:SAM-dependent methyltransferase
MDKWKYYAVTHADHGMMNPMSEETMARIVSLLDIPPAPRVVDIGCGKGALLLLLARRFPRARLVGVDLSPYSLRAARKAARAAGAARRIELWLGDGARYRPPRPHAFDLAACVGASWSFGGYAGTLRALARMARAGGVVVVGEPFWKKRPAAAYLRAIGARAQDFSTLRGNIRIAKRLGLELSLMAESTPREWDFYEGLQWNAALRFAAGHPRDKDAPALLTRARADREAYLRWGRDTLGWAVYVFRAAERGRARSHPP